MPEEIEGEVRKIFRSICESSIPWKAHHISSRAATVGWVELWLEFIVEGHLVCEHRLKAIETPEEAED